MQSNDESIIFARYQAPSSGIPYLSILIRPNIAVDEGYGFDLPADKLDHEATMYLRLFADEVDRRNDERAKAERNKPIGPLGFKTGDSADADREAQVQAALRAFYESQETLMRLGKTPPKTATSFGGGLDPLGEDSAD